uniref:UBC core domain-containing protein n=1 Tax=Astatotilapia calliptera TaxID=8154 RepID=A0AAX7TYR0_ASTCA
THSTWSLPCAIGLLLRSDNEEQSGHGEQRASPARMPFGRKQLPPIPKNAAPITKPSPMGTPIQSANGTHYHLNLIKQKLPGIYVQPSYKSALMWFGVIFIRHGLYQDGVFKFTVYIPDNYPDGECPKLVFDIPVFHPLVDPVSGELDVRRAFTKWRRNHNHIWQVLMYARTVFYKINTTDPLNPEAAVLYEKDVQLFKSKVVDSVKLCNSHLFDQPKIDDPYAISFSPWNPAVHEEAKDRMFTYKRRPEDHHKASQASGLSWVKPGSTQPFSKEDNPPQS